MDFSGSGPHQLLQLPGCSYPLSCSEPRRTGHQSTTNTEKRSTPLLHGMKDRYDDADDKNIQVETWARKS